MDWWQILYSFIGCFLGLGSALLADAVIKYNSTKKTRGEILENIKDELNLTIKASYEEEKNSKGIVYFELPIWQSIVSSGMILSLLKSDKNFYNNIINIYNKVFVIKDLEKNDFHKNSNQILQLRKEVVKQIDTLE